MIIILCSGSCTGKTTLEKKLVNKGFIPLQILTTRDLRHDDPIWVHHVGDFYTPSFPHHEILGVNDKRYFIKIPTYGNDCKYITSIIDVEHAEKVKQLAKDMGYDSVIINLIRSEEDVVACLNDRQISIEEVNKRYLQYLKMRDDDRSYNIELDDACDTIQKICDG